ncbi:NDR1/HIN1-like protein 12 [Gastrolobium bilobum]|uniref:NDR1/HIN1-like protein 12 n=1 Tax=Gastrolobium bilobum TaxID=150636 RepID=UPI002AB135AB|nr:NDR1/HIN1-like protein 12 [Gastrolobium bilobum]
MEFREIVGNGKGENGQGNEVMPVRDEGEGAEKKRVGIRRGGIHGQIILGIIVVSNAHLDLLRNDYAGLLQTQITIVVTAQNGNAKAHATFSDITFNLSYQSQDIALLVADPFDVAKNSSKNLNYVVQSSSIPLTPDQMEEVDDSLKRNEIGFDFKGNARTQWRVGPIGSVKFLCHLNCDLKFHPVNGSYIPSRCTSKSK